MKNRALAMILVAAALGGHFSLPASAQSSIGGVKKQTPLAAPVKQTALGGPAQPAPLKPSHIGGAVKPTSPVIPVNKPGSAAVSPSPLKCPAPCVAKGPH